MAPRIHFISGLPRAGSTLLAAVLRQNPRFDAGVTTPLADLVAGVLRQMSFHEGSMFVSLAQREAIVRGIIEGYCSGISGRAVLFNTNRLWCSLLPLIAKLFPDARVICCLRSPAWVLDSVERAIQKNPLLATRMFEHDVHNVYQRVERLTRTHFLAPALSGLKQAWYGESAGRLIAVRYDSLAGRPAETIEAIYDHLGEQRFAHDFEHVEFDEPQFDAQIGLPGFHKVAPRIVLEKRDPVLPPDLFNQHNTSFWELPGHNPRGVIVL